MEDIMADKPTACTFSNGLYFCPHCPGKMKSPIKKGDDCACFACGKAFSIPEGVPHPVTDGTVSQTLGTNSVNFGSVGKGYTLRA